MPPSRTASLAILVHKRSPFSEISKSQKSERDTGRVLSGPHWPVPQTMYFSQTESSKWSSVFMSNQPGQPFTVTWPEPPRGGESKKGYIKYNCRGMVVPRPCIIKLSLHARVVDPMLCLQPAGRHRGARRTMQIRTTKEYHKHATPTSRSEGAK